MFIKIKSNPEIYVNTDQITNVKFVSDNRAQLISVDGYQTDVSAKSARYLLARLDADEGEISLQKLDLPKPKLTSQIAQALRDAGVGWSYRDLVYRFVDDNSAVKNRGNLVDALDQLEKEKTIVRIGDYYYHASSSAAQALITEKASGPPCTPFVLGAIKASGVNGLTALSLTVNFHPVPDTAIQSALDCLLGQDLITRNDDVYVYVTPSPDPSSATAAPGLSPAADTETTTILTSSD